MVAMICDVTSKVVLGPSKTKPSKWGTRGAQAKQFAGVGSASPRCDDDQMSPTNHAKD